MVGWTVNRRARLRWKDTVRKVATFWLAGVMLCPSGRLLAQDAVVATDGSEHVPYSQDYRGALLLNSAGTQLRVDHSEGPAVGRLESITGLEVFHAVPLDGSRLFYDLRLLVNNNGRVGGNIGLGYREYFEDWDRLLGASVWYDGSDFNRSDFHQVGVSLETFGRHLDGRINVYIPLGDTEKPFAYTAPRARFVEHLLLLDRTRFEEVAMTGFDAEVGTPLPCELGERYNVRAYAGLYHFAGDHLPDILGVSGRLEARVKPDLALRVAITNDDLFNTHVVFGGTYYLPGGRAINNVAPTQSVYDRMEDQVYRTYHPIVAVARTQETQIAADPVTGQPLQIVHVNSEAAPGGDGTRERPFNTLAGAQGGATTGSIIFAHADSVFDGEQIQLSARQQFLGEANGIDHFVMTQQFGAVLLPRATSGTLRPEITNGPGFAIALADDVVVSGIEITNTSGPALFGSNVGGNVRIDRNVIEAGGDIGVNLVNSTARFDFLDNTVRSNGLGDAFAVAGGAPTIRFDGDILNLNGGRMISVLNTTGGALTFDGTLADSSGLGILIDGAQGDVTIAGAQIESSNGTGIDVRNSSGNITFHNTGIDDTNGDGVSLTSNSGAIHFADLNLVRSGAGRGIFASNNTGTLRFSGSNQVDVTGGSGLDITNSTLDAAFETITVANSTGNGITLNNVSGTFTVTDELTLSSINNVGIRVLGGDVDVMLDSVSLSGAASGIVLSDTLGRFAVGDAAAGTGGGSFSNVALSAVQLTNVAEVALHNLAINGTPGNDAIEINHSAATDSLVTLTQLNVAGAVHEAVDVNAFGPGTLRVNIFDSTLKAHQDALHATTTGAAASLELALANVTFESRDRAGARIDGTGGGSLVMTDFSGLRVNGTPTGNGGLLVESAVFDADPDTAGFQAVAGGNTRIGTVGSRVMGDGLALDQVAGELAFGELNVFNRDGTGVFIRGQVPLGFTFGNTGGEVDTVNGTALDIDPVTLSSTFASVTANNASGHGIVLQDVRGSLTVTGATTISGAVGSGIRVADVTDPNTMLSFGTVSIMNGNTYGIEFDNFAGAAQFGTTTLEAPSVGPDGGVIVMNSSGDVVFAELMTTDGGVNLLNSSGSFTVLGGAIATSLGRAVDIVLGSVDATFTDTAISANSGASAVNVFLVGGGSLTIDGASTVAATNLAPGMYGVWIDGTGSVFHTQISEIGVNGGGTAFGLGITNLAAGSTATFGSVTADNVVAGVQLHNTAGDFTFDSVWIDGGVNGFVSQDVTGRVSIGSNGLTVGDGGRIRNVTGDAIRVRDTAGASFQHMHLSAGNNALDVAATNSADAAVRFSRNIVISAGAEGLNLNSLGTGNLSATIAENGILSTGAGLNAVLMNPLGGLALNVHDNTALNSYDLNAGAGVIQLGGPLAKQGQTFTNDDGGVLEDNANTTGGNPPTVNASGDIEIVDPATIPLP